MNLPQPDANAIANLISKIKCDVATRVNNKRIEDDWFVKLCRTSKLDKKSFKETVKEQYLKIHLLENIKFLNIVDAYGKDKINCDLNKIYNL